VRNDFLSEDFDNLPARLAVLKKDRDVKRRLLGHLSDLSPGFEDLEIVPEGGQLQLYIIEGAHSTPARRLSDGTLRFLYLVAILLDPTPPPLIVIEEPELGLHPDLIRGLAELLRRASERTQLIVTTHSTALLDAFSDDPGVVLVCEREQGSTTLRRLERDMLVDWLKEYSLGELWTKGELGGVRW